MKIIGIVMRIEQFDHVYKWFLNESYANALEALGVAVFPICSYSSLQKAVRVCEGLILPGGYDVQAYYLHEARNPLITTYDKQMDHFDFACIDSFVKAQKPILGICRGMQMINLYFHGELCQHFEVEKHAFEHTHALEISEDSFLNQLYESPCSVNSYHHQAVSKLGTGFRLSAATKDGVIEAFEHENHLFYGVQWHPEKMENDQVLPFFLDIVCSCVR